jgi:hypothetical protein
MIGKVKEADDQETGRNGEGVMREEGRGHGNVWLAVAAKAMVA